MTPALRCVLLDIDGTLLDSNDAHARTWVSALRAHGFDVPYDRIRGAIGMGGDLILRQFADLDHERGLGKRIGDERSRLFRAELPRLAPFAGVRDLLARMRASGLTCVVATSAGEDEVGPLLAQAGVADLVDHTTSSGDAEVSKPAPDIVLAALSRAQARPEEALFLGDTPFDVEAGRRAGVDVVAVRSGGWPFTDRDGAVAVYDDAAALLEEYDVSPFRSRLAPDPTRSASGPRAVRAARS